MGRASWKRTMTVRLSRPDDDDENANKQLKPDVLLSIWMRRRPSSSRNQERRPLSPRQPNEIINHKYERDVISQAKRPGPLGRRHQVVLGRWWLYRRLVVPSTLLFIQQLEGGETLTPHLVAVFSLVSWARRTRFITMTTMSPRLLHRSTVARRQWRRRFLLFPQLIRGTTPAGRGRIARWAAHSRYVDERWAACSTWAYRFLFLKCPLIR